MGDRISIQFENGIDKSVVLFSHWGGTKFLKKAERYVIKLKKEIATNTLLDGMPLSRLQPQTVMVDFVRHITKKLNRVDGDLYFGFNSGDGDNLGNGHHIIKLN